MKRSWIMAAAMGCSAWLLATSGVAADAPKTVAPKAEPKAEVPDTNRLNNMVKKVPFESTLKDKQLQVSFTIADGGWTWVEFASPVESIKLLRDGKVVADSKVLVNKKEFMIDLEPGKYQLQIDGNTLKLNRIHRIPEIYYYAPAVYGGMEVLDGRDFWKSIGNQLLESTNLLAPAALTPEERALYRQAGRKTFFNIASKPLMKSVEDFTKQAQARILGNEYDGFTVDEFPFGHPEEYIDYDKALERIVNPEGKRMYTWSYGVKFNKDIPQQLDFVKAATQPATGKGRLMTEIYLETKETEKEAMDFVNQRIVTDSASVLSQIPGLAPKYGIVLGNYNTIPTLTLETVPETDYKYYLDYQLHVLVNDLACKDLGLVGYWGGNYCQEELQRWCLLLLRHYFVYGKREMLSKSYGFKYIPGHLQNGDFIKDLDKWTASPAEQDSIRHDITKDNHGYLMQCRWGKAPSAKGGIHDGNEVAVMVKSDKGVNKLSQKMVNLTPGKPYQLQYVVGSFDDTVVRVNNPRDYGITAILDPKDVDIRENKLYIDQRPKHRYKNESLFSRANVRRIIFVPKRSEVMLTLTDETSKEPAGTQLMVNFVQVKPYFAPEMLP